MTSIGRIKCPAYHFQELLDQEKVEMDENQMKERSTRSFNFGAYHTLDTVGCLHTSMQFIIFTAANFSLIKL